jgi:hypothetical protein
VAPDLIEAAQQAARQVVADWQTYHAAFAAGELEALSEVPRSVGVVPRNEG